MNTFLTVLLNPINLNKARRASFFYIAAGLAPLARPPLICVHIFGKGGRAKGAKPAAMKKNGCSPRVCRN